MWAQAVQPRLGSGRCCLTRLRQRGNKVGVHALQQAVHASAALARTLCSPEGACTRHGTRTVTCILTGLSTLKFPLVARKVCLVWQLG